MNRKFRILCLIVALAFVLVFLITIVASFAKADEISSSGTRGETVYIEADATGNPLSMISSVYISNPDQDETIVDHTTLANIKNITGSETPTIDGDTVTFQANGEDVCYQGTAAGELPFSVQINYYLNGRQVTPEEIAGKDGKVKIEVKTTNNLMRETQVDGEMMNLYVPFSIICMFSLDDSFTAVTATGAKLSAQAGQITIMSVLLPGLAESLDAKDNERIRDSFTVEATAEDFTLDSMMFVGMTGIIDENDLSGIDDIEGLLKALDNISAASTALYSGSKKLTYGLEDFSDGFSVYLSGISNISKNLSETAEGAAEISSGMKDLDSGMGQFSVSIDELADAVTDARDKLNAAADPDAEVDDETKQMIEDAISNAVRENADEIESKLRSSLDVQLAPYIPDDATREAVIDAVILDLDLDNFEINVSDETIKNIRNAILATEQAREMIDSVNKLADGVDQLAQGAAKLACGADQLDAAMAKLSDALSQLSDALDKVDENGETMARAIKTITRASRSLTQGLKSLSEEGLDAVVDETDKIEVSLSRKDALLALSEEYTSFTCTEPSEGDTVQFILTTDEIAAELPIENTDEAAEQPETTHDAEETGEGFFAKAANWFSDALSVIAGWFK